MITKPLLRVWCLWMPRTQLFESLEGYCMSVYACDVSVLASFLHIATSLWCTHMYWTIYIRTYIICMYLLMCLLLYLGCHSTEWRVWSIGMGSQYTWFQEYFAEIIPVSFVPFTNVWFTHFYSLLLFLKYCSAHDMRTYICIRTAAWCPNHLHMHIVKALYQFVMCE